MQLGMMNDPRANPVEEAQWAAEHGFDFLDLTIEGPGAALEQIDNSELKRVLTDAGMRVVGHTAWYLPFALPFRPVRRAAVECVAETFPLFADLGAHWVNVHLMRGVRLIPREAGLDWCGECFAELAERAAPHGLRVMVEHPPDASVGIGEIASVLDTDERLGFHLDVGHANVGGDRLEGLLKRFGTRLAHVHMSDNRGRSDDHMPIGFGTVNWPRAVHLLKQHGYDDTITLEVFGVDRDYLLLSADKVRGWWQEE